jgi:tRNA A37 threonylcarbamoyladenosine modification protein TsaB
MKNDLTLWLDTSTQDTSLALFENGESLSLQVQESNALDYLFETLHQVFNETGKNFGDLHSIHFCSGPGSSLGLRILTMALRTWKVTHPHIRLMSGYTLPVYARLETSRKDAPDAFTLLAQHRKDTWYAVEASGESVSEMNEYSDDDVQSMHGNIYHIRQRKFASQPPEKSRELQPNLTALPEILGDTKLFQPVDMPVVFPETSPSFRKWTPQRHK